MIMGLDRTHHGHQFILVFFLLHLLFVPCAGLNWPSVSFLLHVKYTVSYRIVSYTKTMPKFYRDQTNEASTKVVVGYS